MDPNGAYKDLIRDFHAFVSIRGGNVRKHNIDLTENVSDRKEALALIPRMHSRNFTL